MTQPLGITTLRRLENMGDINFTANTALNLPAQGGQIVDNRFMWGLHLVLEGRATMPATGMPTALSADGIEQLMERITVEGHHRGRKRLEKFFDIRGSDAGFISDLFTLNALPYEPATWNFSASATNDFRTHILVPFVPLGISPRELPLFLLDVPNYETLKLTIQFGDVVSCFGAGTAPTLSAYGSATGVPRVRVGGYFSLAGPGQFANRIPGRVFRYLYEDASSKLTTTATGVRLADIPRGSFMRGFYIKTGTKQTVTSGNNAYGTLSDSILTNIRVNRGLNRPIREYVSQGLLRGENVLQKGYSRAGWGMVDFCGNGTLAEAFDGQSIIGGPTGQVDLFLEADVTGAANQALQLIWEEIQAPPVGFQRRAR